MAPNEVTLPEHLQERGFLTATSVFTLMSTMIVFIFTQRYILRGIVTTGIK